MSRRQSCVNRLVVALVAGLAVFQPLASMAGDEPLQVQLTAQKVIVGDGGAEVRQSADQAQPGDLLEYAAVYRNTSDRALTQIQATLPIPAGTELQANSAKPAPTAASLDGTQFQPFPLKRKVKQPDGTETDIAVPAREYRALRWTVPELKPGASITVSARAQLTPVPATP